MISSRICIRAPRGTVWTAALAAWIGFTGTALAASAVALDHRHPGARAVMTVQAEVTPGLMARPAVLGTAVGIDEADQPVLVVYVDRDHAAMPAAVRAVPPQLRGIASRVELTDRFLAFKPGADATGKASHRQKQSPPIKLGTSGGWKYDLANGYCCGGTLGALIQVGGNKYILSNYHVFEADIVSGGNNRVATTGSGIVQPGLIDVYCDATGAQVVANLITLQSLPYANVDCSIAMVVSGMVSDDGAILEIGTIAQATTTAAIKQAVKKSGRTTGLTRSAVSGLNATISVSYENECAGGVAFTKTFTGQLVVANRSSKFLAGGDSGSLMVEDVATNPRAVGLLYAGSSTTAIANPIAEVLAFIGEAVGGTATMVGK